METELNHHLLGRPETGVLPRVSYDGRQVGEDARACDRQRAAYLSAALEPVT
jgi:hypothetical protein